MKNKRIGASWRSFFNSRRVKFLGGLGFLAMIFLVSLSFSGCRYGCDTGEADCQEEIFSDQPIINYDWDRKYFYFTATTAFHTISVDPKHGDDASWKGYLDDTYTSWDITCNDNSYGIAETCDWVTTVGDTYYLKVYTLGEEAETDSGTGGILEVFDLVSDIVGLFDFSPPPENKFDLFLD